MNRLLRASLLCLLLPLMVGGLTAQEKLKETPFYPLRVGTTWHYRSGDGKFIVRVAKHEKVGDTLCARLDVVRDGKVVGWQHLAVTADGVYRHDVAQEQAGLDGKTKTDVQTPKPPLLTLRVPPKKGVSWKVDSKDGDKVFRGGFQIEEQEVTVPAGKYKAMRVASQDLEINALKPIIHTYYAEGVGMVKQTIEVAGAKIVIELEKFEADGK